MWGFRKNWDAMCSSDKDHNKVERTYRVLHKHKVDQIVIRF